MSDAPGIVRHRSLPYLLGSPSRQIRSTSSSLRQAQQARRDDVELDLRGAAGNTLRLAVQEAALEAAMIDGTRIARHELGGRALNRQRGFMQVLRESRPELLLETGVAAGLLPARQARHGVQVEKTHDLDANVRS